MRGVSKLQVLKLFSTVQIVRYFTLVVEFNSQSRLEGTHNSVVDGTAELSIAVGPARDSGSGNFLFVFVFQQMNGTDFKVLFRLWW